MRPCGILLLACALSCSSPPFGEVLVVVDTDIGVPTFASQLRIDLYAKDGTWYDSRDVTALTTAEWPLSFSIYTDEPGEKQVRMRLRAYPTGGDRTYRGERPLPTPFVSPVVKTTLADLCANVPDLPPLTEMMLRRGPLPLTEHVVQGDCQSVTTTGSVAVQVQIPTADTYRFEVIRDIPDGAQGLPGGDATLFLRTSCMDSASQLGCADNIDFAQRNYLPSLVIALQPGTYTLVSGGGSVDSPADLTLRWSRASDWGLSNVAAPVVELPNTPRLLIDGVDATPTSEPQPGLAIDRLVDLSVTYGSRRTANVLLAGDCLGTQADLAGGASCTDTIGVRVPVVAAPSSDGINHAGASRAGTWSRQQPAPCTTTPRTRSQSASGTALYDEEICMTGGAFTLGDELGSTLGSRATTPRQVVALAPFLLDRYEVTVARYREAVSQGFAPTIDPKVNLIPNNGILLENSIDYGCTWNGDGDGPADGVDRETMPLNCVGYDVARAFCQYIGGDLPTHAQWEYAARAAGHIDTESWFPWGDAFPDCSRGLNDRNGGSCAMGDDRGPQPVDASPWADGDQTPLGVVGMGGSESEWVVDSFRPYSDSCWWQAPLAAACNEDNAPVRSMRGGNWWATALVMVSFDIIGQPVAYPNSSQGFRCARPGAP